VVGMFFWKWRIWASSPAKRWMIPGGSISVDAKATNRCRWCGAPLRFDFALAVLSLAEPLRPFVEHALSCKRMPIHQQRKWQGYARRLALRVN
jgi:hypothetical protein